MSRAFCPLFEYKETDEEHDGQSSYTEVDAVCKLADEGDQQSADKGGAFSADVIYSEILAGFFRRDDLGIVRTGYCLYRALKKTDAHGQYPELILLGKSHAVQSDEKVGEDADSDQVARLETRGDTAKYKGRREGHYLSDKEREQKAGGIKSQSRPVSRSHVDNGINAVYIKEEGNEEYAGFFVAFKLREDFLKPDERFFIVCSVFG